ncbi:MAG: HAMP domain-containing histidine kinase [Bdellovibrionales bacterium]|nr:HAMP domain-containing histidine kinase [Bdellovibrionales bacterium]
MLHTRIFRRHYLITAIVLIAFVITGHFANLTLMRMGQPPRIDQPLFFAKIIRSLDAKDPVHGLQLLEAARPHGGPSWNQAIADENGKILYPPDRAGTAAWTGKPPPLSEGEVHSDPPPPGDIPRALTGFFASFGGRIPPPPQDGIVRLYSNPPRYLITKRVFAPPPGAKPVFFSFAILLTSILGGAGVSLLILFRSLRNKAALADEVIAELQSGNLKARFPIDRVDEIGQTMLRFNRMAEEIERLVERLRTTEQSRMQLLQELGHDLRTPVASLKNMLETLATKGASLEPKVGRELMDLSRSEVDYFERLIEDLLVLAQIGEPNYQCVREPTDLSSLVEEEAELLLSRRGSTEGRKIDVVRPDEPVQVCGDAHLLRRAVRNALENAYDFSKETITVEFGRENGSLARLEVRDDGPGFSDEQLAKFGERRMTRKLGPRREGGRISIGLGSVIMKTILDIHRGSLSAENWQGSDGRSGGARVILRVPAA